MKKSRSPRTETGNTDWINYHHLLYFWVVAREGSVVPACEGLQLSQPTISGQLAKFEESLRCKLFRRVGRSSELTEEGRVLFRYADEIFTIGREMVEAMKGRATGRPMRSAVGVAHVLPKLVVYRLLEPACRLDEPIELVCHEGKDEHLVVAIRAADAGEALVQVPTLEKLEHMYTSRQAGTGFDVWNCKLARRLRRGG